MNDASRSTTQISLLGRQYVFACSPEEQDKLERAARYLDKAMTGIHAQNNLLGTERVAIMAALNIVNELLETQDAQRESERNLDLLSERLEQALSGAPQPRDGA